MAPKAARRPTATVARPHHNMGSIDNDIPNATIWQQICAFTKKHIWAVPGFIGISSLASMYQMSLNHQERQRPITMIMNAQVYPETGPYLERDVLAKSLVRALDMSAHTHYFVMVTGNHQAGKTQLLHHTLKDRQGVVRVALTNQATIDSVILQHLGVNDMGRVVDALKEAKTRLGHPVVIMIDIHAGVIDDSALQSVSTFAKEYGFEQKVANVVVVCSTAAASYIITGDGRRINFFVPPCSLEEFKQAKEVLGQWIGKEADAIADKDIDEVYHIGSGTIGKFKEAWIYASNNGMDELTAQNIAVAKEELLSYLNRDSQMGFGPAKVQKAGWLALQVGASPFEQCFSTDLFPGFSPKEFGIAVREAQAHPIYYDPRTRRYCASSRFMHEQLKAVHAP